MNSDSTTVSSTVGISSLGNSPSSTKSPVKFRFQTAVLLFVLAVVFFLWSAPWRTLESGPDEGMEFSKMQLLLQHPEMGKLAWNDQSWFYSQVFAAIFNVTGFQCGIPRLTTFVIVVCLLLSFPRLMPKDTGWPHLICAWLFFWSWSEMPQLSVSAMLEVPAIGLAIIAATITPRDRTEWRKRRFLCAGILFAIAVQIKLTALIILPAMAVKLALLWWGEIRVRQAAGTPVNSEHKYQWWRPPALGCGAFSVLVALIAWWSPDWDWSQLWSSHFAADSSAQADKYRLEPQYLLQSPGTLVAALLGIIVLWRKHRLHEVAFTLALLVTVFVVFFNHRPWWSYYGIHFAIPLAVLGGWGAAELLQMGMLKTANESAIRKSVFTPEISMMLGALAVSLWAGFEVSRGYENTRQLGQKQQIVANNSINELEKYRGSIKWVFTQNTILTAQAGYLLPPELTIMPLKRYWTGKLNDEMLLDTIKRYQCEALILNSEELRNKAWNQLVNDGYVKVWSEDDDFTFVAKRLNPAPEPKRDYLLKQFGL